MYNPEKAHYISVTGIIVRDSKFLIIKRAPHKKNFPNKWTVPGGKVEVSDYSNRSKDTGSHWYNVLESTLRREVKEETALEIENIRYLTSLAFIRSDDIPTIVVSLYADPASEGVSLDEDHIEYKWVTLEEAKDYDLIEGIWEELAMLNEVLKGKEVDEWSKDQRKL